MHFRHRFDLKAWFFCIDIALPDRNMSAQWAYVFLIDIGLPTGHRVAL
jgi:hypothetical protein